MVIRTLTAEQNGEIPQLGHVEGFEDLTLVGGTVTVQDDGGVGLLVVLLGKSQTGTDGNLGADDTVTTVEVLGEHVHRATLAVGDTLATAQQLTDDRLDGTAAHQSETVATVGGNNLVLAGDSMLNTDSDGFLTGRQMAETTDLLLFIQAVGGHLHATDERKSTVREKLKTSRVRLAHTEWRPCRGTSASAPSWSSPECTEAGRARRSRSSRRRGGR